MSESHLDPRELRERHRDHILDTPVPTTSRTLATLMSRVTVLEEELAFLKRDREMMGE